MRFRKIRFDGEEVVISSEDETTQGTTETTFKSAEQPSQAFRDALQGLREHVVLICECPPEWIDKLTIHSVSISYSKADVMTVAITALRELTWSTAPMIVNTPAKPETPHSEGGDDTNCLSHDCLAAIDALTVQTLAYLDGDRWAIQDELPMEDNPRVTLTGPDGETMFDGTSKECAKAAIKAGRK